VNNALLILVLVVVVSLVFDYINGFHDAANAVATVVSTGVLPLHTAVLLAALLNFVGALTGTAVASTIGKGLVKPGAITQVVVLSALSGAILWNLVTWYFGIPSSSSHALVGGLIGSSTAHAGWRSIQFGGLIRVVESLVFSPLVGFAIGFVFMVLILWLGRAGNPSRLTRTFRRLQIRLGRLDGRVAREQRCPENDGYHRDELGRLLRRVACRGALPRPALGHGGVRNRDVRGDDGRRGPDH
jgi:inorganic phosphate transporter, PiT family